MSGEVAELLRERLTAHFQPVSLVIRDDSHLHAGHAGARGGGHFHVDITAGAFAGKSTVQRHRMIYDAAADLMRDRIHALSIQAGVPGDV